MNIDIRELMEMLGERDIIIREQTKMIEALNRRIEELEAGIEELESKKDENAKVTPISR
jgi:hypothetical protein